MRNRTRRALAFATMMTALLVLPAIAQLPDPSPERDNKSAAADPPTAKKSAAKPARKNVNLPGLTINFQQRCVDLEATVCLDEGMLELVACTKETKEHESIVAIKARPMHVHTALLLLGANNGNPAMQKPVDEQKTHWVHLPPRGDPVDVYLVFEGRGGKMVEHPISDFVARAEQMPDTFAGDAFTGDGGTGDGGTGDGRTDGGDRAKKDLKFPGTFLFAGSQLHDNGDGPRTYLADHSGNVISIATYGDELLCLPGVHSKGNDSLMWQVDATKLPKVGANVTLRLRPQAKPAAKPEKTDQHSSSFNSKPQAPAAGTVKTPTPAASR